LETRNQNLNAIIIIIIIIIVVVVVVVNVFIVTPYRHDFNHFRYYQQMQQAKIGGISSKLETKE